MSWRTALPLWLLEIVHDDNVTGLQDGNKDLFEVDTEGLAVNRVFEKPWSLDPIVAQGGHEGCRLPKGKVAVARGLAVILHCT